MNYVTEEITYEKRAAQNQYVKAVLNKDPKPGKLNEDQTGS